MEWAAWVEWECNFTYTNEFKKGCKLAAFFFATNKQAEDFKNNIKIIKKKLNLKKEKIKIEEINFKRLKIKKKLK